MGASAVARAAPAHPVVTELVPFRISGCLLVTAPGRLIVLLGGLTFPLVGDCLHAIHWFRTAADHPHLLRAPLSGTEERPRDDHQPMHGQSPGAEAPESDPRSANLPPRAEGPERGNDHPQGRGHSQMPRALIGGPHSPQPPLARNTGKQGCGSRRHMGKHSSSSRRMSPRPTGVSKCSRKTGNTRWPASWWVNRVGTYGMASAQLYWGRKASLVLKLLYYIFPQVDWHLVFVDDYCWVLRCSRAEWDATAILATLLALGVPLSWKKTALSPINTWLGFQQGGGASPGPDSVGYFGVPIDETFPPAFLELEEGLHHFGQATQAGSCVGHPFGKTLQPDVLTGISICSHTSMDGGI